MIDLPDLCTRALTFVSSRCVEGLQRGYHITNPLLILSHLQPIFSLGGLGIAGMVLQLKTKSLAMISSRCRGVELHTYGNSGLVFVDFAVQMCLDSSRRRALFSPGDRKLRTKSLGCIRTANVARG